MDCGQALPFPASLVSWSWRLEVDNSPQRTNRILLVDDDAIVRRIYGDGLSKQGFEVETADDGLLAMKLLKAHKPDAMVLDLMMPRLSGVDVLRYMHSQGDLTDIPVIVLTNSYLNELAKEAAELGVYQEVLKVSCTPTSLAQALREALDHKDVSALGAHAYVPAPAPKPPAVVAAVPAPSAPPKAVSPAATPETHAHDPARDRSMFLEKTTAIREDLRKLFTAYTRATDPSERHTRLENVYRKVHFITASAGLAGCANLAQMAAVFEALLFELVSRPSLTNTSLTRTLVLTVDFLCNLLDAAASETPAATRPGEALVVDDDPLSNRLVVAALLSTGVVGRATEDPLVAMEWAKQKQYQIVFLDIEMPGMDGFEFCKRLRDLPGYKKTPVVYITNHTDFEHRAKSAISGADDLIGKPVFPIELAVKSVMQLLRPKAT
jgi:CheY-like chemotaxis protein